MSPKHIILISIDDLRFDAVRWQPEQRYWKALGIEPRLNTPTMDALAGECVLLGKCVSNAVVVDESHSRWGEYQACRQEMSRLTAAPHFGSSLCAGEEKMLTDHLRRLGYVQ